MPFSRCTARLFSLTKVLCPRTAALPHPRIHPARPYATISASSQNLHQLSSDHAGPNNTTRNQNIILRSYQEAAISACLDALQSGSRRLGVSSPTGSGKTTIFLSLIPQVPFYASCGKDSHPRDGKGQTLIIVNSVELAEQTQKSAERLLGDEWTIEIEQSKRVASGLADVTIATYQTLNNRDRLSKFDPSKFKLVIVDEAHHSAAPSYLRLLHYFNEDVQIPKSSQASSPHQHGFKVPIIGFSATFSRADQHSLHSAFEEIVFHRDMKDMLSEKHLTPAKLTIVQADLELDEVETSSGDFKNTSLARKVNTTEINELIVRTYLHRASERRSTLVFCVDLGHVSALTQTFRNAGVDARSVSSKSKPETRKATIAAFGKGEFPVLINCEVLTEGTDIPQIDCILLARPTQSRNLLVQMVGRGLRLSPESGKTDCHIIDLVDSVTNANGLIVTPTLLGLSLDEMDVEDHSRESAEKAKPQDEPETLPPVAPDYDITYLDQDDPFHVDASAQPVIQKVSKNAWVSCGNGKYALELIGSGTIIATRDDPQLYSISYRPNLPHELTSLGKGRSPYGSVRVVGHAPDLERALQAGDKFAEKKLGRGRCLALLRYAPWRQRLASENAIKHLLKRLGEDNDSLLDGQDKERVISLWGKKVSVGSLTAGEVSSWLCAMKNGAKSIRVARDKSEEKARAKVEAKAEKERQQQLRNLPLPSST
ncbi:DEAD box family helicase [Cryptococcus neoformans Tu401-1]|nr:DEAD box family helicase [Cryptococcus neoformans var. grubii Bt85]OXG10012.1 DEAD box family helicase [Cryptococcus neoformans var. grubii Tu401-1]OXM75505.1 DEAD box family helicase [Cryptococcus neoformans var. grubii Bt63]